MQNHSTRTAPFVAAFLLILPLLYLGSYLALVTPGGTFVADISSPYYYGHNGADPGYLYSYRFQAQACSKVFWPLEQIDRKLRRRAWHDQYD